MGGEHKLQTLFAGLTRIQIHWCIEYPSLAGELSSGRASSEDIFNIVMADCSGSMHYWWRPVVEGWQHVRQILDGG